MRTIVAWGCMVLAVTAGGAMGAVVSTTTHAATHTGLDGLMSGTDLLAGLIGVEQPGDQGWHPANGNPADQLPAMTDGLGAISGLTGLMNDFPGAGNPAKLIRYDLGGAKDVAAINIFTGNAGKDGRVFSTSVILYSTDGGQNFSTLGYFQSDPSGTVNAGGQWGAKMVSITDDVSATLLAGVTHIQFNLYAVDNTQNQMRDPFDGVNPYTGIDDGLTAAFVSPLVYELDVIEVPEPTALVLISLGGLACLRRRRVA